MLTLPVLCLLALVVGIVGRKSTLSAAPREPHSHPACALGEVSPSFLPILVSSPSFPSLSTLAAMPICASVSIPGHHLSPLLLSRSSRETGWAAPGPCQSERRVVLSSGEAAT
jgi:hypothetical protein